MYIKKCTSSTFHPISVNLDVQIWEGVHGKVRNFAQQYFHFPLAWDHQGIN